MVLSVVMLGLALASGPAAIAIAASGGTPTGAWLETGRLSHVAPHVGLGSSQTDFGTAVAIDGGTALVGAPYMDAAFVYERADGLWSPTTELTGPDSFGEELDIDGDTIAVGAPDASEVHVFERAPGGWALTSTLTVEGAACLGAALAIDGGLLAAGDPCGSRTVYLFEPGSEGWDLTAELTVETDSRFGRSVDLSGGTLLVGGDALYAFEHDTTGWSSPQQLGAEAGPTVALSGNTAATLAGGKVIVLERAQGTWSQVAKLVPQDSSPFVGSSDRLGWDLELAGGVLAVGASAGDASPGVHDVDGLLPTQCVSLILTGACLPQKPGAVYVFESSSDVWGQVAKLTPEAATGSWFGTAVAIDSAGDTILSGAPGHPNVLSGFVDAEDSVHVFSRVSWAGVSP